MTNIKMPEPVGYLHQCRKKPSSKSLTWAKDQPQLAAKGYFTYGLITTTQAEAYAQAVKYEALEALETAQEYIADALFRHDQEYSKHPATQAEREQIKTDLELIGNAVRTLKREQL